MKCPLDGYDLKTQKVETLKEWYTIICSNKLCPLGSVEKNKIFQSEEEANKIWGNIIKEIDITDDLTKMAPLIKFKIIHHKPRMVEGYMGDYMSSEYYEFQRKILKNIYDENMFEL